MAKWFLDFQGIPSSVPKRRRCKDPDKWRRDAAITFASFAFLLAS
jgi:hypothetical protein